MSDMSRPGPLPPAEHVNHDALLVAQFVAGDSLDAESRLEAQALVSSCRACSLLAADLRAVSSAVAQEAVPPRRRDYRIDSDQAERLQGNAASRYLRRLSLPRARAFQPLAAGAMSLGLALVVVGYAWPQDGTISVDAGSQAAPALLQDRAAASSAPIAASPASAPLVVEAPEVATDTSADLAPPIVEQELSAAPEGFAEEAPAAAATPAAAADDLAARIVDGVAKKASRSQAGEPSEQGSPDELESVAAAAGDRAEVGAASEGTAEEKRKPAGVTQHDVPKPAAAEEAIASDPDALGLSALEADAMIRPKELSVATDTAIGDANDVAVDTAATAALPAATDAGPEDLLVIVGLGLAVIGGSLLILAWLVRRTRDPLLR